MCPPTDTPSEPEFVKRAREIRERRDREAYKESSRGGVKGGKFCTIDNHESEVIWAEALRQRRTESFI